MKKMPTVFKRDPENLRTILREVHPDAQWVLDGEGVATYKYDGTCTMIREGKLYKRYMLRPGKTAPDGFEAAQEPDPTTGKQPGWVPVSDEKVDRYYHEALMNAPTLLPDGTYELCGPKVQSNPEGLEAHIFISHADAQVIEDVPRDFDGLREFLRDFKGEGIVFHHPDGRYAKIKVSDFKAYKDPA